MSSVLVFTGRSGVDGSDFRWQLLRVPEISKIFKDAQQTLDACGEVRQSLISYMQADTNDFLSAGLWRELCAQLVQIGLFKRYEKQFSKPQFIVGDAGEISAAAVCLNKLNLEDLIIRFVESFRLRAVEEKSAEFLIGHRLETSKVYEYVNGEYISTTEGKDTWGLLEEIRKDYLISQVITLGSSQSLGQVENMEDLGVVESVVMDPLLSWMLPYLKVPYTQNVAVGF